MQIEYSSNGFILNIWIMISGNTWIKEEGNKKERQRKQSAAYQKGYVSVRLWQSNRFTNITQVLRV